MQFESNYLYFTHLNLKKKTCKHKSIFLIILKVFILALFIIIPNYSGNDDDVKCLNNFEFDFEYITLFDASGKLNPYVKQNFQSLQKIGMDVAF